MPPQPHDGLYQYIENYKKAHSNSPSYDEMMEATGKSRGAVQNSLNYLEKHGYIRRIPGRRRNIEVLKTARKGVPIRGEIAAGYLSNPFTETAEHLPFEAPWLKTDDFALRVSGDSMINACIPDGAFVIMRTVPDGYIPPNGEIAAVYVAGVGMTLKHFHREGHTVTLKPSNPNYPSMPFDLREQEVNVQAILLCTLHGKTWATI
jgi:repressor LexA